METRRLGRHGLEVSSLCLGTMTFGYQIDAAASFEIMDKAFDHDLKFFDSADVYPAGGGLETAGATEEIIGRWMKERGNRDQLILATKCCAPTRKGMNNRGLSRQHIIEAVEQSLRRLDTDYIDLYQAHGPDPHTPIEETLRAFDDLVRQGKVRYVGCSNYMTWRLSGAVRAADQLGITGYVSVQPRYNMLYRDIEVELIPFCRQEGMGVIVFNPLAGGFLSGKYKLDRGLEEGTRFTLGNTSQAYQERYWQEEQFKAVEALKEVVEAKGLNMVSVAVAWTVRQPGITSALIGASNAGQLDASLASGEVVFDDELEAACEALWWSLPRRPHSEGYR